MLPPDPPAMSRSRFRALLLIVLLVALAVRSAWAFSQPAGDAALRDLPDQVEYVALARSLLAGNGLVFHDARFDDDVRAYRAPGYPAFLAACGGNVAVARQAQAVLDTSTVLAAALLALALLPAASARRGAVVAAVLVAVNPLLVGTSALLLSETVFTATLTWGMVLLLAGSRGGRLRLDPIDEADGFDDEYSRPYLPWRGTLLWLAGGAVIAASALVRPSAVPLAVIVGAAAAVASRPPRATGRPPFKPRWPLPVATTMMLVTVAVLAPWAYRNKHVVGELVWTTTNSGVTLWDGLNPDARGDSNQAPLAAMPQLRDKIELEPSDPAWRADEVRRSEYLAARAREFATQNPKRALELAAVKVGRTWSPVPLSDQFGSWRNRAVLAAYSLPLYLLALIGLWLAPLRRSSKAFLLVPAVYFTLVHAATVGSIRYRIPAEPPMAVLAAAGLSALRLRPMAWRRAGEEEVAG